ncbi:hypothetical protein WN944_012311 [Citrus x changshan-huyou]|uniref:Uncharacterized protein n=1 Tax=Citrus x changshan-huyou TaxID=2935761 RepID=A0AAP0N1C8_9ROSI
MLTNSLLTSSSILVPCADCSSPMATEQIHEKNILYELFMNVESELCSLHCLTNDYCHYLIVVSVTRNTKITLHSTE